MVRPIPRGPIDAVDALERVEAELLSLLSTITAEEWDAPTIVPGWRVRHVAGHLLDTATRKLAVVRDGFGVEQPATSAPEDVRDFVDRLNAEGVRVYGRLSHPVVWQLMAQVSPMYCAWHRTLDPAAPAAFAVSWAGDTQSPNWFDTARELTERWHHQAQIRLALNRPLLDAREVYHPGLDCFMRVMPYAYRGVDAPTGTLVSIRVDGPAADDWQLYRAPDAWLLTANLTQTPNAVVSVPGAVAWRMLTKGIERSELERRVTVDGDRALGLPALQAVAIVGRTDGGGRAAPHHERSTPDSSRTVEPESTSLPNQLDGHAGANGVVYFGDGIGRAHQLGDGVRVGRGMHDRVVANVGGGEANDWKVRDRLDRGINATSRIVAPKRRL